MMQLFLYCLIGKGCTLEAEICAGKSPQRCIGWSSVATTCKHHFDAPYLCLDASIDGIGCAISSTFRNSNRHSVNRRHLPNTKMTKNPGALAPGTFLRPKWAVRSALLIVGVVPAGAILLVRVDDLLRAFAAAGQDCDRFAKNTVRRVVGPRSCVFLALSVVVLRHDRCFLLLHSVWEGRASRIAPAGNFPAHIPITLVPAIPSARKIFCSQAASGFRTFVKPREANFAIMIRVKIGFRTKAKAAQVWKHDRNLTFDIHSPSRTPRQFPGSSYTSVRKVSVPNRPSNRG